MPHQQQHDEGDKDRQLAALVRALLVLEAKLKSERKRISLQFHTKNALILQQRELIKRLKRDASAACEECARRRLPASEDTTSSSEDHQRQRFVRKDASRRSSRKSAKKEQRESLSSRIETLHGIKPRECETEPWYAEEKTAPADDWYASASDQDDDRTRGVYKNNPVLECVNQILLQNNLDESVNDDRRQRQTSPKASAKRVQFSTLNSISFEEHAKPVEKKIVKFSLESEHNYESPAHSIYSNDYEPIASKKSNHYVDMEVKTEPPKRKIPPALPPKPKNLVSKFKLNQAKAIEAPKRDSSSVRSEPDYCSISEVNVPVRVSSQTVVEIHAEKFSPNLRPPAVPKMATISKITPNKISDKDIPKLPQVTEIIIPDEEDAKENVRNASTQDARSSGIQIGHSVSSILTRSIIGIEDVVSPETKQQKYPIYYKSNGAQRKTKNEEAVLDDNDNEKFDLSQNFEEFKIDDCEFTNVEEYKLSSEESSVKDAPKDAKSDESLESTIKLALKNYSKLSNKPDLLSNIENLDTESVRYSDIESSNSSSSNCGSYNTVKREPSFVKKANEVANNRNVDQNAAAVVPFEYFLENSGLSSKSILTPTRPPNSNHKNVLKPKDVKMRSKNGLTMGRSTPLYEKCSNTAIKYFEPYL